MYVGTRSFTSRRYVRSIIEFLDEPIGTSMAPGRAGSFVKLRRAAPILRAVF